MIHISLSFSGKKHEGERIQRDGGSEEMGDNRRRNTKVYQHQQRKRKAKIKRREQIPYGPSARPAIYDNNVFVRTPIWKGRIEKAGPKKWRRTLPNVK